MKGLLSKIVTLFAMNVGELIRQSIVLSANKNFLLVRKVGYQHGTYHEACFSCSRCNNPIGSEQFINKEDKRYCQPCFNKFVAKVIIKYENIIFQYICPTFTFSQDNFMTTKLTIQICFEFNHLFNLVPSVFTCHMAPRSWEITTFYRRGGGGSYKIFTHTSGYVNS